MKSLVILFVGGRGQYYSSTFYAIHQYRESPGSQPPACKLWDFCQNLHPPPLFYIKKKLFHCNLWSESHGDIHIVFIANLMLSCCYVYDICFIRYHIVVSTALCHMVYRFLSILWLYDTIIYQSF